MSDYSPAEMQRCPLETVILQTKMLNIGSPQQLLSKALQPPSSHSIETALTNLKDSGMYSYLLFLLRFLTTNYELCILFSKEH